ncbi:hypothetical protein CMV_012969 [Castanea mollissima]|uniref:DUF4218 domain-containing protein n=1 Tax=Castanea mollissima TaxID=60419 RepID=A0A8J4QYZ4_9ROSI|nr:hypothetical protein CMV_012969 [Castanea mollissima]
MYPIERYLGRLKSYVRNRAAPEGSIAEGYIVEECLTFCSRYMEGVETIFNRPTRTIEESTGVVSIVTLSNREWTQAHRYVLFNSENINHFREMHKRLMEDELRKGHHRISEAIIYKHHMEKFCSWFRCHVMSLTIADREREGTREEELEAGCTAEQARADASADGTQPPAMRRDRGLTVVQVGEGNGRSRQSVQEELDAAFAADQARGDASDDDETQPPDDVVQETPASNNLRKKRGNTLLTRIWSFPPNMKIEYSWTEIEKRWIIDPEIIQPADQMTWAMHQLGELRRNRRGKLKRKCYKDGALREDVIQSRPTWADEQEFIQLVDYWFHEDTRTLSSTNKRSRGKQKEIARSGPISFAQTADDMAKETGQAVERAVLFAKVYSTKEGHPVTPDVGEKIKQMNEILARGSSLQGSRREGILCDITASQLQSQGNTASN